VDVLGDLVTMNDERQVRFVLNATSQPKQITWVGWEGVNEKMTEQHFNGIYKLDGDRLTIAYRQNGRGRRSSNRFPARTSRF